MATNLSSTGLEVDKVEHSDIPSGATGKVLLYASGSGANTKLYVKEGSNTQKQLGFDIDQLTELDSTALDDSNDHFAVSDAGDEKKITFANLKNAIYADVSSQAAIAAGGALSLDVAAITGQTEMTGDVEDADEFMISDGGALKRVDFSVVRDAVFADVGTDVQIAAGGAATIQNDVVTNAKLANISRGSVKVGGASNAPTDLDAKGDGKILVGDGTDVNSVAVSGDITLANDGTAAIATGVIVNADVSDSAAIAADKLDFNVDLGGNITFGDQANDTVTFTGHVNVAQQLTASHAKITNLDVVTLNSIAQTETTLEVADKLIVAALSASSANSAGGGLQIGGGANSDGYAALLWDHTNSALDFNVSGSSGVATQVRLQDGVLRPESDSDVDLGTTGARFKDAFVDSITVTGEVDAASLDISGNADIDGTLEADAITVNGVSLQVVVEDHVGAMLDGTETGISVSYDATDNNLDFVIDAAQTTITSILATDLKIGEDDETKIDFETADEIHFYAANAEQVYVADGVFGPQTDSDVALGASGVAFSNLFVDAIDLNGQGSISIGGSGRIDLDADDDTSIRSSADDQIDFEVGGTDLVALKSTGIHLIDDKKMFFGSNDDASIEYDEDGTNVLRFAGAAALFEQNVTFGNADSDQTIAVSQVTASAGLLVSNQPLYVSSNIITDAGAAAIVFDGSGNTSLQGSLTTGNGYSNGGMSISTDGSGSFAGGLEVGSSANGLGGTAQFHGVATGEKAHYSPANNIFQVTGSAASGLRVNIGGDETTEFAVDVADGSNNNNKMRAAAFVTYSDESLKQDVTSMANTALDTIMSLEGVEFTWKNSGERDFGFIAQDVQKVVPKAVHTAHDGVQGVDYSRLTSILVEAVKSQQVQIEELKALLKK